MDGPVGSEFADDRSTYKHSSTDSQNQTYLFWFSLCFRVLMRLSPRQRWTRERGVVVALVLDRLALGWWVGWFRMETCSTRLDEIVG